jgi:aromatic ring-opening dioxygenase LigB subunit
MIKSAFILPHCPLLIPAVAKNNAPLIQKTAAAYDEVRLRLEAEPVDNILIVSQHGSAGQSDFAISAVWEYKAGFEKFGDFATKAEWSGHPAAAYRFKEALGTEFSTRLQSDERLDHGSAIPLFRLLPAGNSARVVTFFTNNLDLHAHYRAGELLGQELESSPESWAIIASADLSHRLTRTAPAGYSPKAAKFDNKLIEYLSAPETAADNILKVETRLAEEVKDCGLKAITALLGTIKGRGYRPQVLSYQSDLGVGYLAMALELLPVSPER